MEARYLSAFSQTLNFGQTCGTCWDPGPTSSWSCAPSVSLPPYDASSQARAARARRRQPMAISTCAFPSFYVFCSFILETSSRIFSNQLFYRFHCNTPKHELTGGSKSRKQVERSKACHINSYDLHGHVPHLLRLPNSKKNLTRPKCPETLSQIMRSRIQVRVFGFSTVFISSHRSVKCPPPCQDHLAFFIGKICKF